MPKTYTRWWLVLAVVTMGLATLSLASGEPQPDALPVFDPDKPLTEPERAERLNRVKPGLSPDQVRQLLGPPRRTARQILYHRAREQWVYEAPFSVRLEFEYVRGQEPHLLSVQPTAAGKP
jgi:hypothetical protein